MTFLRITNKHKSLLKGLSNYSNQFCFISSNKLIENNLLEISDEVKYSNKPLVALESTIITHGLPYPTNLEMALEVENEIKLHGALPATIAFLDGKLKVGLCKNEIEKIAKKHEEAIKISRRDLPYIYSKNTSLVGGTTVSATCIAAHAANIPIFCTGGIGGVHRDYIDSMDVSADLQELARTPVAVVSSGVKSILDIEKTLEYLETMGVCVTTLNKNGSKEFPSFFTTRSGYEAPYNCLNEKEAASLIDANLKTGFNSGLLIAVPIPEEYSADDFVINNAIKEALQEAFKLKIKGKKVTPFLLDKISKITKGKSLKSNLALIKNNARTSAKIAVELAKIKKESYLNKKSIDITNNQVSIIGGTNLDLSFKLLDESTLNINGVTQPGKFSQVLGGVGRNMAEALVKLGIKNSILISSLSNDLTGKFIKEELKSIGLDTSKLNIIDSNTSTGTYCAVFGTNGDLKLAIGDMKAHDFITPEYIEKNLTTISDSDLCVIDADIPVETIKLICNHCEKENIPIWFNPTDLRKCTKILNSNCFNQITYMSPNYKELLTIFKNILDNDKQNNNQNLVNLSTKYFDLLNKNMEAIEIEDLKIILKYMLKFIPFIILTRGKEDLVLASSVKLELNSKNQLPMKNNFIQFKKKAWEPHIYLFPTLKFENEEKIVNVSGAGDSTTSGIIAGIIKNYDLTCLIYNGLISAKYSLLTDKNISDKLNTIDLDLINSLVEKNNIKTVSLI